MQSLSFSSLSLSLFLVSFSVSFSLSLIIDIDIDIFSFNSIKQFLYPFTLMTYTAHMRKKNRIILSLELTSAIGLYFIYLLLRRQNIIFY